MMRSLWTGASGMTSQQLNVDVISNNIANVNTTGYKKERAEFQTLLYQTMAEASPAVDNTILKPNALQVGHGVRPVSISRVYDTGSFQATGNTFDFSLDGPGFFQIEVGDEVRYTKDGSFKLSQSGDQLTLVTSDGFPVLDVDGEHIILSGDVNVVVDLEGRFFQPTPTGSIDLGIQFGRYQFSNPNGLSAAGKNLYEQTIASGEAIDELEEEVAKNTGIVQSFLEMSNVQIADEMVKLIVAQRAYELNSKTITTSDEMLQQANNLKR